MKEFVVYDDYSIDLLHNKSKFYKQVKTNAQ